MSQALITNNDSEFKVKPLDSMLDSEIANVTKFRSQFVNSCGTIDNLISLKQMECLESLPDELGKVVVMILPWRHLSNDAKWFLTSNDKNGFINSQNLRKEIKHATPNVSWFKISREKVVVSKINYFYEANLAFNCKSKIGRKKIRYCIKECLKVDHNCLFIFDTFINISELQNILYNENINDIIYLNMNKEGYSNSESNSASKIKCETFDDILLLQNIVKEFSNHVVDSHKLFSVKQIVSYFKTNSQREERYRLQGNIHKLLEEKFIIDDKKIQKIVNSVVRDAVASAEIEIIDILGQQIITAESSPDVNNFFGICKRENLTDIPPLPNYVNKKYEGGRGSDPIKYALDNFGTWINAGLLDLSYLSESYFESDIDFYQAVKNQLAKNKKLNRDKGLQLVTKISDIFPTAKDARERRAGRDPNSPADVLSGMRKRKREANLRNRK